MSIILITLIAACVLLGAFGAYAPDEITALPGWEGSLPTRQYSGYLNVSSSGKKQYFMNHDTTNALDIHAIDSGLEKFSMVIFNLRRNHVALLAC